MKINRQIKQQQAISQFKGKISKLLFNEFSSKQRIITIQDIKLQGQFRSQVVIIFIYLS